MSLEKTPNVRLPQAVSLPVVVAETDNQNQKRALCFSVVRQTQSAWFVYRYEECGPLVRLFLKFQNSTDCRNEKNHLFSIIYFHHSVLTNRKKLGAKNAISTITVQLDTYVISMIYSNKKLVTRIKNGATSGCGTLEMMTSIEGKTLKGGNEFEDSLKNWKIKYCKQKFCCLWRQNSVVSYTTAL